MPPSRLLQFTVEFATRVARGCIYARVDGSQSRGANTLALSPPRKRGQRRCSSTLLARSAIRHSKFSEGSKRPLPPFLLPRERARVRPPGGKGALLTDRRRLTPSRELAKQRAGEKRERGGVAVGRSPPIVAVLVHRMNPRVCAPGSVASSPVVGFLWSSSGTARARPRTYHFFGDSRRGNILAHALSSLPSLRSLLRALLSSHRQQQPELPNSSLQILSLSFRRPTRAFRLFSFILPLRLFVFNRSLIT